jgi:two-component system sensor histidine kinase KdpD
MSEESPIFEHERLLMQRSVFSSVAHDLKTPLVSIIGSLEILDQMKASLSLEQQDSLIKTALAEAHRLENLIANAVDTSKP